jgi:hypothetical protein
LQVALVMHVSRGDDNRLSGTVQTVRDPDLREEAGLREFSGTLELMRVFEELVPGDRGAQHPHGAEGGGQLPGPSGLGVQ